MRRLGDGKTGVEARGCDSGGWMFGVAIAEGGKWKAEARGCEDGDGGSGLQRRGTEARGCNSEERRLGVVTAGGGGSRL